MAINTRTRSKKKTDKLRTKVADVIVSRIIKSIEEDKRPPWQKPFLEVCYNWLTEKDYTGINRIMLRGEYIGFLCIGEKLNFFKLHFIAACDIIRV